MFHPTAVHCSLMYANIKNVLFSWLIITCHHLSLCRHIVLDIKYNTGSLLWNGFWSPVFALICILIMAMTSLFLFLCEGDACWGQPATSDTKPRSAGSAEWPAGCSGSSQLSPCLWPGVSSGSPWWVRLSKLILLHSTNSRNLSYKYPNKETVCELKWTVQPQPPIAPWKNQLGHSLNIPLLLSLSQATQSWPLQPTMIRQGPWWSTLALGVALSASWPLPLSSYLLPQHKQVRRQCTYSLGQRPGLFLLFTAANSSKKDVMHTKQQIAHCGF